nr:hypothetical protein [Tanacetum cinerariifolium]
MADNLPKIVWYSTHHVVLMKSWLVQKKMALGQTATGKEISNPFMADVVSPTPTSPSPSSPVIPSLPPHQSPFPPQPQATEGSSHLVQQVLSMQEDTKVQEAVKVVTTAKLITEVVTAAATQVAAASTPIPAAKPKTREEMEKEDEEIIKSINETPAQKAAKRRKLSEEAQEADDLRRRLEIVQDEDDDVFVEAIPLAQKVSEGSCWELSEDLETLWKIVKDRFSTKKLTNFSDEYLLLTLKTMFGELDEQDAIWRNQKSVHGLALVKRWKLMTSCGVHMIILSIV